jgi:hydrogenase assembly chaperone HypC/HupF
MCVTAPGLVLAVSGDEATVECGGVPLRVSMRMVPDLVAGEHVLVGFGAVIGRLGAHEARAMAADLETVVRRRPEAAAPGRR